MSLLGQLRAGCGLALVVAALAASPQATACSFAPPNPNDISVAKWVAQVDQIVLARVVASRQRTLAEAEGDHDNDVAPTGSNEFTFETVERLKGNTPQRFTVNGVLEQTSEEGAASASLKHRRIGRFWLYYAPEEGGSDAACQWAPRLVIGSEYLVFRDAKGALQRWYGRAAQVIPSRDDPWLLAVRRLIADPKRKYGRSATIPQILASAVFVVEGVTERCPTTALQPPPPPGQPETIALHTGHRIVRQLWGAPVEHTHRLDGIIWLGEKCRVGEHRIAVYFQDDSYNGELLRLAVSDGKVDFTGVMNGTERGLIDADSRYGLWYAQVELPAKAVWTTDELAGALNAIAAGKSEADGPT